MRIELWTGLLVVVLAAHPVWAQETRGNVNGIVQDQSGVIPGAVVRITNTDTNQTHQVVTNTRGYFEAVLLNAGTYSFASSSRATRPCTRPASRWPSVRP